MTRHIRDVLQKAAPAPTGPPDLDWIRTRGRRLAVTRVATVASVVVLVIAGVAGVALGVLDGVDEDPAPMIVDPPSPAPTVDTDAVCAPAPYRPTYLPWDGSLLPIHIETGDPEGDPIEDRDARIVWSARPDAFDPASRRTQGARTVELVTVHAADELLESPMDDRRVEVVGHTGSIVWVGDLGVGDVALIWREHRGLCGAYELRLSTVGIEEHLDFEAEVEAPSDPDVVAAIEEELLRIAGSLVEESEPPEEVDDVGLDMRPCDELDHHPEVEARQQVAVYFYCVETTTGLVGVPRDVPSDAEPIAAALEHLLRGPTADEAARGFTSTIGEMDTDLLEAAIVDEGTLAVIDLTGMPDELSWGQRSFVAPGFMEEIAWTVFNLHDTIDAIELRHDGSCDDFWDRLTGEDCRTYTRDGWGHVGDG